MNSQRAILSNESNYTVFRVGDKVIRFRARYSLEHYTEVKEWNHADVPFTVTCKSVKSGCRSACIACLKPINALF